MIDDQGDVIIPMYGILDSGLDDSEVVMGDEKAGVIMELNIPR